VLAAWLKRLETQHPKAMDLGLERVQGVWQALGAPRPAPKVVTVAGTNGKGSAVATLRALAQAEGLRVGDTTSPHLHRFNERIVVQGAPAEDDQIVAAFERIEVARGTTSLTYFETAILAALLILKEAELDLAILEVGLGGRLDAVNIIDADVALVTPVDLDHQAWLGTTREAIGREKAGIFRPGHPVVIADPNPPASVLDHALALGCPLARHGEDFRLEAEPQGARVRVACLGARLQAPLTASLPVAEPSFLGALQAFAALGYPLEARHLTAALAMTPPPGRQRWLEVGSQTIVFDVAHNPHAAAFLASRLEAPVSTAVFGCFEDKDAEAMFDALAPKVRQWAFVDTEGPRGQSAAALADRLRGRPAAQGAIFHCLGALGPEALTWLRTAGGDRLAVLGSFTVVAAAERLLGLDRS